MEILRVLDVVMVFFLVCCRLEINMRSKDIDLRMQFLRLI